MGYVYFISAVWGLYIKAVDAFDRFGRWMLSFAMKRYNIGNLKYFGKIFEYCK